MHVGVEIVVVLLLILLNGLFAMSEMALVSSRKGRLKQLAEEGDRGAQAAVELAEAPGRFLSTVQIGITLIGIVAGAFGGATLADSVADGLAAIPVVSEYRQPISVTIVVLTITFLSLVIGELVPKRLALYNAEDIARVMARPMRSLARAASPIVRLLNASSEFVLWLLRARMSDAPPVTEEEVRMMLAEGTRAGVFNAQETEIVERVFSLADQDAESLMVPRAQIVFLDLQDPPEENWQKIVASGHSNFLVYDGGFDNIQGVVHVKRLLAQAIHGQPFDLRAAMQPPLFVLDSLKVLRVLELFKQSGQNVAVVQDEFGGVLGLMTLIDVLDAIVGGVTEGDGEDEPRAVQRAEGSWLVDGLMPIEAFKEQFRLPELPGEDDQDFSTLGGFVLRQLGRIPTEGDTFEWNGLRFEVVDMDRRRVDKVLVHRSPGPNEEAP